MVVGGGSRRWIMGRAVLMFEGARALEGGGVKVRWVDG